MAVMIIGGGIGGLTLALSLHQIGVPARVFESVETSSRSASASTCCRMRCAN